MYAVVAAAVDDDDDNDSKHIQEKLYEKEKIQNNKNWTEFNCLIMLISNKTLSKI